MRTLFPGWKVIPSWSSSRPQKALSTISRSAFAIIGIELSLSSMGVILSAGRFTFEQASFSFSGVGGAELWHEVQGAEATIRP
jgi:hypothetical protein